MINSITVIGNGIWGNKIKHFFESFGYEIHHFGARVYAEEEYLNLNKNINKQIFWIATTPDLQIKIASNLSMIDESSILILEKPFFRYTYEQTKFLEAIENLKLKIKTSCPWAYSDLWIKSKKSISELKFPLNIDIIRSGPSKHTFIRPEIDWLSHDIQLLTDLFDSKISLSKYGNLTSQVYADSKQYGMIFSDGSKASLNSGVSKMKIAVWSVYDSRGYKVTIDFNLKYLRFFDCHKNLLESYQSPINDNPLLNMIRDFQNPLQNTNIYSRIKWQEVLIS